MNNESIKQAYRRYAPVYDAVFGPVFHPGRRRILETLDCQPDDAILEVGVGTGLSLPLYPDFVKVTGIDVCEEMLEIARRRVESRGLPQAAELANMDAADMSYADNSFDKVVAMYVVSVTPDPVALCNEMARVCKPGGDIFIVNHFRSRNPLIRFMEGLFKPFSKLAGFRPDLDLDEFIAMTGLDVVETRRTNLFGYWQILHCRNGAAVAASAEPIPQAIS